MKKKVVALMLTAVMMTSLAACGNTDDANKDAASGAAKEESAKPSESVAESVSSEVAPIEAEVGTYPIVDEPITVTCGLIGGYSADSVKAGRVAWDTLAEITGINIEYEVIEKDAVATYLASGNWPDFFLNYTTFSPAIINDYGVLGGKFLNYLDYMEYMPNLAKTFEDYPIAKAAVTETNGAAYGLPYVEDSATVVSARTMVRTDILEEYNLEIPSTVNQFYETLKTLKEKTGQAHWVPAVNDDEAYWHVMVYAAFGTEVSMNFDDDGTGKVIFNRTSDQMKHYLEFMNKLYSEELIHQEFLTMDNTVRKEAVIGTAFPDGSASASIQSTDFADGQFHVDGIEPLTSEYDSTQELLGVSNFRNAGLVINADTEYAEEICRMLDVCYATEEVVEGSGLCGMSFCYGIQGKDWFANEDGETYSLVAPDEYNGAFNTYQYDKLVWQNVGRIDALAGLINNVPGNSSERQKAYVKGVHPFMADHYFPTNLLKFNDDEQYVIDNKLTDIKTYYKEMEGKFITGAASIDKEWDTYCQTLTDMGIEDVLAAYQSAYDRWLASIE